ncbi:restriction endonuclease [Nocardia asiatica]|uniref:restriction endonuclease n=1 Tax=Nocardia asiatica TaxID=209252 RepID=UPI002457979C|nr:hypothetical protein [Nocardia asiatica]
MNELDITEIHRLLKVARTAEDTDAQGKAYEELAFYLFEAVPGCFAERNGLTYFKTEQIDLAVCNSKHQRGLYALPHVFLIECKNWSTPVDSSTLGYFINILRSRRVETGILIAANGVTGDFTDLTYAHSLAIAALNDGINILVVTTEDLEKLTCTNDFVQLILRRFLRTYLNGGLGVE